MICKICNGCEKERFKLLILNKYSIRYYQCESCGFLQTEYPFWISEAYSSVISDLDVGYVSRNLYLSEKTQYIIDNNFNPDGIFLDYAGGYGLLVRLMRDKGFNFYWNDAYCKNLFAQHFKMELIGGREGNFELITGFEVLEHLIEPYQIINKIFEYSDSFLFSTELQPNSTSDIHCWWYLAQESGQHISFYTLKSLKFIADKYSCQLYSNNKNLHLFTKRSLKNDPFKRKWVLFNLNKNKKSLLKRDFSYIKSIHSGQSYP